jgi:hypothetical protein
MLRQNMNDLYTFLEVRFFIVKRHRLIRHFLYQNSQLAVAKPEVVISTSVADKNVILMANYMFFGVAEFEELKSRMRNQLLCVSCRHHELSAIILNSEFITISDNTARE